MDKDRHEKKTREIKTGVCAGMEGNGRYVRRVIEQILLRN